jgi:cytochrome c-type biogenesis protein CcmF
LDLFGSYGLLLAFALAVYAIAGGIAAIITRHPLLIKSARNAGFAVCVLTWFGMASLVYLFLTDNFAMVYVAEHSNRNLATLYKISAVWAGQEGSLLFWSFLLSIYVFSVLFAYRGKHPELMPYVGVVVAAVQLFFLTLNNFVASPFKVFAATSAGGVMHMASQADGHGLNPLLQYPEMVIHPPMLYLGYVGFTVPFAFALGALAMRYPGEKWIHITRRWTMVTWGFLTCGIFLGMHWAYKVLGWGGYWGWDPVENASLMPWLTGTAFLHSVMMQEKRGMLKVWNMWLIFATFGLSIFGTFLTRSGVISSVHAFAESSIGNWFVTFLIIIFAACLYFFFKNRSHLRTEHKLESLVSRESSFLFNNLLLLVACFTVLWGTLFPILSEWVEGHKVTVGPPFFNRVNIPVALLLLLLTAVGPLLAWRRTSLESIKRNFLWPTVGALLIGLFLMLTPASWGSVFGMKPWKDISYFYSLMTIMLSALVALTIILEFVRGGRVISRHTGQNLFSSMVQLGHRNTRRYGGYIVHFGVIVVIIGLAGSAFNQDKEMEMGFGDRMDIGGYTLVCRSFTQDDNPNYGSEWAVLDVFRGGKQIATMYPERRFYKASQQTATMVADRSTLKEDLYLVYEGQNQDTGRPIIKAHLNPLVMWIWIGVWIMIVGTALALVPNAAPVRVTAPARVEAAPVGAGD